MTSTYQHKIIAQHLQSTYGHIKGWPFCSAFEIERELCRRNLSLNAGDYLVVGMDRNGIHCGKVGDLQGLSAFPSNTLVISYHELERAFHEQHTHWVEL
jgi:hypothetical protein